MPSVIRKKYLFNLYLFLIFNCLIFTAFPLAASTFTFSTASGSGTVTETVDNVTLSASTNTGSLSSWDNQLLDSSNSGTYINFAFSRSTDVQSLLVGFTVNSGTINNFTIQGFNGGTTYTYNVNPSYDDMICSGVPKYIVDLSGANNWGEVLSIRITVNGDCTVTFVADTVNFTPPPNTAPTVQSSMGTMNLQEDFSQFTINMYNIFQDSEDADSDLNYSILSQSNSSVSVGLSSNILTVNSNSNAFSNGNTTNIRATDTGGLFVDNTLTINVAAVNDKPTVTTNTGLTLNEGATATISNTKLAATDIDDDNNTLTYTATDLPDNGVLKNNGSTLSLNGTFTQADLNNNLITYVHDGTNTTSDAFIFKVADGVPNELTGQTFNITVNAVDDDTSTISTNTGLTLDEGATAGIPLEKLESDDADSDNSTLAYTITTAPINGQLENRDNPGIAITGFTQQNIIYYKIQYVHDDSNTISDTFTFKVSDGVNELTNQIFSITVNPVDDDTPTISINAGLTLDEGATADISVEKLESNDTDSENSTLAYTITTAPINGRVENIDNPGIAITSFTQQNIIDYKIQYVHDDSNTISDTFTFKVSDGVNELTGQIFSITVNPVNDDTPTISTNTGLTLDEGATAGIQLEKLESDDADSDNSTLAYTITTAPINGRVENRDNPGIAITSFTQQNIIDYKIQYVHDDSNTNIDSFTFKVADGIPNELTNQIFSITVTPVDDDTPTISVNTGLTLNEGATATISNTKLASTDDDSNNNTLTYTATDLPDNGVLKNNGSTLSLNGTFTQADLNNNLMTYVHDGTNTTSDSFTFKVADGIANELTGQTFNITVNAVDDDTPTISVNNVLTLNEGATAGIPIAKLAANDTDSDNNTLTYTLTAAPSNGQLENSDSLGNAITSFTQQNIADNKIQYVHNDSNTTSDSFTFKVADGIPNELTGQTFNITVNPVDDDTPTISVNNVLTLNEGATAGIPIAKLAANDTDSDNNTLTYTLTAAPTNGQLENTDSLGNAITSFTQQNIVDNKIQYVHDGTNTTSDSFTFKVADGIPNELTGQIFNITVNAVDDDTPTISVNNVLTLNEGATAGIPIAKLAANDTDSDNNTLTYTLTAAPSNGQLENTDNSGNAITSFTQQNLSDNKIQYVHDSSNTTNDSFTFKVADGIPNELTGQTFNITVNPVNDAPDENYLALLSTVSDRFDGQATEYFFGYSVSNAGDVNKDGYSDIIVGAYLADNNGIFSGSAYLYSGLDNSLIHRYDGEAANNFFGKSVSTAGDFNKDGYSDIIVGAYGADNNGNNSGSAYVYSGLDNSLIYRFDGKSINDNFGVSVSTAGDVDKDGYADIIVGSCYSDNNGGNSGSAYLYSGLDNSLIHRFDGQAADDSFGYSVSKAGDVNKDGYADIIIGAYFSDNNGSNSGSAYLYSGLDNSLIHRYDGEAANDYFGYSVSTAGDVNKDGYADIIIGAYFSDNNGINSGSAYVYSGLDNSLIHRFDGQSADDSFGYSVSTAGDVNKDGNADIIIGAYGAANNGSASGSAYLYSGLDNSLIHRYDGEARNDYFGISVSTAGDVNKDDYSDIIVGAYGANNNGNYSGSAYVYKTLIKNKLNLSAIDEDPNTNNGETVSQITSKTQATDSEGDTLGLAITSVTDINGTWQYSLDSGNTWNNVSDAGPADSSALLLISDNKLRFVPNANHFATADSGDNGGFSFKAWDQTSGSVGAINADTMNGTAWSAGDWSVSITVNPVNDTPTISVNTGLTLNEGATACISIAMLAGSDVDTDNNTLAYTITTAPTNGRVENIDSLGNAITSFTQQNIIDNKIQFVHNDSNTISDTFKFKLADGVPNELTGQTFNITVTPVNDPPVLLAGANKTLTKIYDISLTPPQTLVSQLISGNVTDEDNTLAELSSIFISSVSKASEGMKTGTWQYRVSSFDNWVSFENALSSNLGLETELRYLPQKGDSGNAIIEFSIYDGDLTSVYKAQLIQPVDSKTLFMRLTRATSKEDGSNVSVTSKIETNHIYITSALASDMTVYLSSSNPERLKVSVHTVIKAGSMYGEFDITPIDDKFLNGNAVVTVNAYAPEWAGVDQIFTVVDNETKGHRLILPQIAVEGGSYYGTVKLDAIYNKPLSLVLGYILSTTGESLETIHTIPAGESDFRVPLQTPENDEINPNSTLTITTAIFEAGASTIDNPDWGTKTGIVTIIDNDNPESTQNQTYLSLLIPEYTVNGSGILKAEIRTTGQTPEANMNVSISDDSSGVLTFPSQIVILAGTTSAQFNITVNDKPEILQDLIDSRCSDSNQNAYAATIWASSLNVASSQKNINIYLSPKAELETLFLEKNKNDQTITIAVNPFCYMPSSDENYVAGPEYNQLVIKLDSNYVNFSKLIAGTNGENAGVTGLKVTDLFGADILKSANLDINKNTLTVDFKNSIGRAFTPSTRPVMVSFEADIAANLPVNSGNICTSPVQISLVDSKESNALIHVSVVPGDADNSGTIVSNSLDIFYGTALKPAVTEAYIEISPSTLEVTDSNRSQDVKIYVFVPGVEKNISTLGQADSAVSGVGVNKVGIMLSKNINAVIKGVKVYTKVVHKNDNSNLIDNGTVQHITAEQNLSNLTVSDLAIATDYSETIDKETLRTYIFYSPFKPILNEGYILEFEYTFTSSMDSLSYAVNASVGYSDLTGTGLVIHPVKKLDRGNSNGISKDENTNVFTIRKQCVAPVISSLVPQDKSVTVDGVSVDTSVILKSSAQGLQDMQVKAMQVKDIQSVAVYNACRISWNGHDADSGFSTRLYWSLSNIDISQVLTELKTKNSRLAIVSQDGFSTSIPSSCDKEMFYDWFVKSMFNVTGVFDSNSVADEQGVTYSNPIYIYAVADDGSTTPDHTKGQIIKGENFIRLAKTANQDKAPLGEFDMPSDVMATDDSIFFGFKVADDKKIDNSYDSVSVKFYYNNSKDSGHATECLSLNNTSLSKSITPIGESLETAQINEFEWNTSNVTQGYYQILANVYEAGQPVVQVWSNFTVAVLHSDQADTNQAGTKSNIFPNLTWITPTGVSKTLLATQKTVDISLTLSDPNNDPVKIEIFANTHTAVTDSMTNLLASTDISVNTSDIPAQFSKTIDMGYFTQGSWYFAAKVTETNRQTAPVYVWNQTPVIIDNSAGMSDLMASSPLIDPANVGKYAVKITFRTSIPAIGTVKYGKNSMTVNELSGNMFTQGHSLIFSDLDPDTRYYYSVSAESESNQVMTMDNDSQLYSFKTPSSAPPAQSEQTHSWITGKVNTSQSGTIKIYVVNEQVINGVTSELVSAPFISILNNNGIFTADIANAYSPEPKLSKMVVSNVSKVSVEVLLNDGKRGFFSNILLSGIDTAITQLLAFELPGFEISEGAEGAKVDSDIIKASLSLQKGWNLVCLPIEPVDQLTASDLFTIFGNKLSMVALYNSTKCSYKAFLKVIIGGNVIMAGDDFELNLSSGFFVKLSESASIEISGKKITREMMIPVNIGYNMVGVNFGRHFPARLETGTTAGELLSTLGVDGLAIYKYENGRYIYVLRTGTKEDGTPDIFASDGDFDLKVGQGLFIKMFENMSFRMK